MLLRTLVVCLLVSLPLFAQNLPTVDASRGVEETIASLSRSGATWFAWRVPFEGSMYCWPSQGAERFTSEPLILAHVERGELKKVRFIDPVCNDEELPAGLRYLTSVAPESSLAWLHARLRTAADPAKVVSVIAMHAHPSVAGDLIALARNDPQKEIRRAAIFWLGHKAGEKAAGELRRSVDEDPDEDVRKHAVFAIAQLPPARSVPMLIDLVKTHKSREVRRKAMFWLAQTDDPRALQTIEEILQ